MAKGRWVRAVVRRGVAGYMAGLYWASSLPGGDARLALGVPDYALHGTAYALLALLWRAALARGWGVPALPAAALAWALSTAYGALDEVHQTFVPGRDPSFWDLAADAAGAGIALAAHGWWRRRTPGCGGRRGTPRGS